MQMTLFNIEDFIPKSENINDNQNYIDINICEEIKKIEDIKNNYDIMTIYFLKNEKNIYKNLKIKNINKDNIYFYEKDFEFYE